MKVYARYDWPMLEQVRLTYRERVVLRLRLIAGLTLHKTGLSFGVQGERIRQIEAKALRKLRHPSHYQKLERMGAFALYPQLREKIARKLYLTTPSCFL